MSSPSRLELLGAATPMGPDKDSSTPPKNQDTRGTPGTPGTFETKACRRRARRPRSRACLLNLPIGGSVARCLRQSLHEIQRMAERFEREMGDAGPEHPSRDSEAAPAGA